MNLTLRKPAELDVSTVSGISQAVLFRFFEADGTPMDVSGATFRCAVRGPGSAAIKCEAVDSSSAKLSWGKLYAGTHLYDVFMICADGRELPLVKGSIIADARITPTGTQDITIICGEFEITMPDTEDGAVRITDSTTTAAERAEAASKIATDAVGEIIPLAEAAQNAANNSAQSSTAAANSATSAQQALAAIPTVDAAGNMTLPGNLTANGATVNGQLNANGGINLPLGVVPSMPSSAVSNMYAAGLATVSECYNVSAFYDAASSTAIGSGGTIVERVPGQVLRLTTKGWTKATYTIAVNNDLVARTNYTHTRGFFIPFRPVVYSTPAPGAPSAKFTVVIGYIPDAQLSERLNRGLDDYTVAPLGNANLFEILDITFYETIVTDTPLGSTGAFWVRVREVKRDTTNSRYVVKTTRSLVPAFNTGLRAIQGIVYQQSSLSGYGSTTDKAGLWLMMSGLDSRSCLRIANVRGIDTFTWPGFSKFYWDSIGYGDAIIGVPRFTQYFSGVDNAAYYGFAAIESNMIQSETTADFVDPEMQA